MKFGIKNPLPEQLNLHFQSCTNKQTTNIHYFFQVSILNLVKMISGRENEASTSECLYTSGGCNRSPHCISWRKKKIIYGCANAVNIVQTFEDVQG